MPLMIQTMCQSIALTLAGIVGVSLAPALVVAADALPSIAYAAQAKEVTQYIQRNYYDPRQGLYLHSMTDRHADFMWANGIMFSALVGAAKHEPATYAPIMKKFFLAMDRYWDAKALLGGYEPSPTTGNGHDKYYDDNEWMVLTFVEAYELTHEQAYLDRAITTMKFCLSGWDDKLGGGIWWHEGHKGGSKNTCSNAPAAEACIKLAGHLPHDQAKASVAMATKIVDWTTTHLQSDTSLFMDNIVVATEKKNGGKLTYNTALMIRANLGLYRATDSVKYLDEARRQAKASDWFVSKETGAYRDNVKWSHLLIEADLELYRQTHEAYLLARAKKSSDYFYKTWKAASPTELIENASVARLLWLMADAEGTRKEQ